jgi:hypothetical protein
MLRSIKQNTGLIIAILSLASLFITASPLTVSALSGSEWNPGNIIDDGVFYDNNAMSVDDVQNFLNIKMTTCDTNGDKTSELGGGTRAQYGASRGYPAPFICLKNYFENPSTHENNLRGIIPAGAMSAAQIIKSASDTHKINPKVLITLLQKEQTLVTDEWPLPIQYKSATGYGCPDTAACDAQYYGFYNQVMNAARQFRLYATYPASYRYKPYQTNYIQYNPEAGCGGTNVYVQNLATAGLYNYTPYQPNQSALNNLYGSGDSCGAYGNRNFWRLFNEWFGGLYVPYIATNAGQTAALSLSPGQSGSVNFRFKNSGNSSWIDGVNATAESPKVHLATSGPVNRSSRFSSTWPTRERPNLTFTKVYEADGVTLTADQHVVNPGQIAEYTVSIVIPEGTATGVYTEAFLPVRDGAQNWNMRAEVSTNVTVVNKYKAAYVSQDRTHISGMQNSNTGSTSVKFKNTGSASWKDDLSKQPGEPPVHLATFNSVNRSSRFSSTWPTRERPNLTFTKVYEADGVTLTADQHVVNPGQIAEYIFSIVLPDTTSWGTYRESFGLVAEGYYEWDMGASYYIDVQVHQAVHSASYYSQSAYPRLSINETSQSFLGFKNTGNSTWYDDISRVAGIYPIHLATDSQINRSSSYQYNWPTRERPNLTFTKVYEADGVTLTADQHVVNPGQIAWFQFEFKNYNLKPTELSREGFVPVLEGSQRWNISSQKVWLDVTGR